VAAANGTSSQKLHGPEQLPCRLVIRESTATAAPAA
jgi:hypothetical protein